MYTQCFSCTIINEYMAIYKQDKVLSVRLSIQERKALEDIAQRFRVPVSSVARSFIQSSLYRTGAEPIHSLTEKQTVAINKFVSLPVSTVKVENTKKIDYIDKEKYYPDGLPRNDINGNPISANKWAFAKSHPNNPCRCGGGKSFKRCHRVNA